MTTYTNLIGHQVDQQFLLRELVQQVATDTETGGASE